MDDHSFIENVRVSSIDDGKGGTSVISSTGGSQSDVVSVVENDLSLRENSIVFDLSLSDGGAVVGEDDELSFTISEHSEGGFVAHDVLSTLHHQGQLAVDVLGSGLLCHYFEYYY